MLAGGTDGLYRALLAGPHHQACRVEVWRSGARIDTLGDPGLPIQAGSVTATLGSQVTRQCQFSVDESLWPVFADGLLAPYGNYVRVFQSVGNGATIPYEWETFRGRINDVTMSDAGLIDVDCLDRAADINDAGFILPETSVVGSRIVSEFQRLIREGVDDATFGTFSTISGTVPALTWERSRASACDDLATSAGAFWYALANGDYVIRLVPWTVPQTPLITMTDGEGGTLFSAAPTRSRENVFNGVTAVGEQADGSPPVYSTQFDNNPTSATFVGGPFGRKFAYVSAPAAQSQAQALTAAQTALHQATSLTQSWTVTCPPDPSLELGDAVIISARNLPPTIQVVSSFGLSMVGGPMSIAFRALQPGLVVLD